MVLEEVPSEKYVAVLGLVMSLHATDLLCVRMTNKLTLSDLLPLLNF